ncbi:hypothetical protein BC835DRAFT_988880 [Cytidiella melzeri]|nr:hypothetical protein BC835DRAFT_988880 [Cytidiella melzeri]
MPVLSLKYARNCSMPVKTRKVLAGLLALPNELLLEIGELLFLTETTNPGRCIKFTATWVLARVNRRLRAIILPLLFRELNFKSPEAFVESLTLFSPGGKNESMAPSVRSIRIWRNLAYDHSWTGTPTIPVHSNLALSFCSLNEFECNETMLGASMITILGRCGQLKALAVACVDVWPVLKLVSLTNLQTLRLFAVARVNVSESWASSIGHISPTSYTSITTLGLYRKSLAESDELVEACLKKCHFPNLCVLVLQSYALPLEDLFHFIHQHPTLLEVNVDTAAGIAVRVEALLKLIDGTGTWKNANGSGYSGTKHCQIGFDFTTHNTQPYPPHLVADTVTTCRSFAFTRAHLGSNAPLWTSAFGSVYPRYSCTALTMHRLNLLYFDEDGDKGAAILDMLKCLSLETPNLVELRIQVDDLGGMEEGVGWLVGITDVLHNLSQLRKLAIHWRSVNCESGLAWGDYGQWFRPAGGPNYYVPIIDDIFPPFEWIRGRARTPSLSDLTTGYYPLQDDRHIPQVITGVRALLNVADDEELDEEDETLIMQAWLIRNERLIKYVTEICAAASPSLEEFDWFFFSERFHHVHSADDHASVVWSSKISRPVSGKEARVAGTLRWTGCLLGDPPPFYPLVGQELERATKLRNRAWIPMA